jgi:hypothetical protein
MPKAIQTTNPVTLEQTGVFGQATGAMGSGVTGVSFDGRNEGHLGETDYGVRGVNGAGTGPGLYGVSGGVSGQPLPMAAGVVGDSGTGHGVYGLSDSGAVWRGSATSQSAVLYSGVMGLNSSSGYGVSGVSEKGYGVYAISYQSHAIYAQSGGSVAAVHVEGDLEVTGDIQVNGNVQVNGDVMLLNSGSDCAEQFEVATGEDIEPGTVVTFEADDRICESREAYDTRVAGVVSGAGGYRPGIVLGKRLSSKNQVEVGLVGKVYCKVDAQYGRIRVGDLLTTSATRGHAMKATNREQAFGAVIGKALGSLETGRGMIPILVALQ